MKLNPDRMHWGVLSFLVLVILIQIAQHLMPPQKARSRRATMVNVWPSPVIAFDLAKVGWTNTGDFFPIKVGSK